MPGFVPDFQGFGDDSQLPDTGAQATAPADAAPATPVVSNPLPTATPSIQVGPAPIPAPAAAATPNASRRAGVALLFAGVGAGTGALVGGLWGAGSGLFFSGAAMNAFRARQLWSSDYADDRAEAVKSTVMSVVGLGLAAYLGYKANEARREDDD